ncbi:hypothetical protein SELMODRAFT_421263 [Selaginella moellendorffii]|uniref:Protein-tyrosine-phosphatase n=1 Tax=Selaginella moellendorffii TaxID=88036 RepID=D8SEI2_SELML|nr:dual specificity protein phosphatase 1B [Selaginella moellendorffii]EFJ17208.1 hypothetical protein SELMODRAFT_421263 [Selaginella moellendorffii]|eukprot:XP_002981726.1 dual specificity protein phosphatase 1B [Selaginella moellendorffii]
MNEIREGLFLGSIDDAVSCLVGRHSSKISHVLSVANIHLSDKAIETRSQITRNERKQMPKRDLVRKEVPLVDSETQNILERLEECLDFIEHGRQHGGVLVHCLQGISRSASVVTAYLMRSERLSVKDALASLRLHNEMICPNPGFMHQLELFYEMKFTADKASPAYSRWNDIDFSKIPQAPELSHCIPESKSSKSEESLVDGLNELFT